MNDRLKNALIPCIPFIMAGTYMKRYIDILVERKIEKVIYVNILLILNPVSFHHFVFLMIITLEHFLK